MASILETCAGAPSRDFAAGDVLLSEGNTTGRLYILAGGAVEVLRGNTQVAVVGDPGAVFGEMSVLLNRPHTATVKALTPVRMFVFDDAEGFLKSKPDIAFFLSKLLAQRLAAATTYLVDLKRQFAGARQPPRDGRRSAGDADPPAARKFVLARGRTGSRP